MEALLRSSGIRQTTRLELLDNYGNVLADVSDRLDLAGSVITRDATGLVDGTAVFQFRDVRGFDAGRHRLRPWVTIEDLSGLEESRTWEMGTWVMSPFERPLRNAEIVAVECYDTTSLLSTKLRRSFAAVEGENISVVVRRLLEDFSGRAGIAPAGIDQVLLESIPFELDSSPAWALAEQATYLEVANAFLEAAAYSGLYMGRDGTITAYAWQPIDILPIEWRFDSTRPDGWISGKTLIEPQIAPVPNTWIGVCSAIDQTGICNPVEISNRNPLSPWSIPSQGGRRVVRVIEVPVSLNDRSALVLAVKQVAEEDRLRARRIRIETGPLPHLWQTPVVEVTLPEFGIQDRRGIVREWSLPLDYANEDATYIVDLVDGDTL